MRRILALPLLVILMGIGALSMLLPALHAAVLGDDGTARVFLFGAVLFLLVVAMVGLAGAGRRPKNIARSQLAALAGAYVVLPIMFAIPFHQAVPDTTFFNAWFEMVSSFTTTGASLYDEPDRLAPTLHLWRALVGWMGGLLILIGAAALLAPLDLGGAEVISGRVPGRGGRGPLQGALRSTPSQRLVWLTLTVFPVYVAYTLVLWVLLLIAGEHGLLALCLAMSTLSSSSITPAQDLATSTGGTVAEVFVFLFLLLSVTRRSFPGAALVDRREPIWQDKEVRLAGFFLVVVPCLLFLRHWIGAVESDDVQDLRAAVSALWGALFMTLSFLTTTGFDSAHWQSARSWSGLPAPGLILLGLAMMGGGIATTSGGLKLLRVHALVRQGERELDRSIHPHSIGGGGETDRRLRNEGAYAAWIFFMLYALSLAVVIALLALVGVRFDDALVLAVAALSTTGPLAAQAAETPIDYADLTTVTKSILAATMVLGRLEVLAVLSLLAPSVWRQ